MSNEVSTPSAKLASLFEGIFLGRTLHDLEEQAGASIEDLLKAVRDDEQAFLDFKSHREWATYVQESEVTTKLRDNADEPVSPAKTNALKLWADHMHWVMERANPGVFSGKQAITTTVPIQIVTTLDLGGVKRIEDVYDLTAEAVDERKISELSDKEFDAVEAAALAAPASSPFDEAVGAILDNASIEEAAARLEAALNAGGDEEVSETAGNQERIPKALETNTPRAKPRRKRKVDRSKQALVVSRESEASQ